MTVRPFVPEVSFGHLLSVQRAKGRLCANPPGRLDSQQGVLVTTEYNVFNSLLQFACLFGATDV